VLLAVHIGMPKVPPVAGNGRAVDCSFDFTCAGVSDGCAESINATVPETSGAEKLVPSDASKLSV
jgi:hypothetical protein